MALHETEKALRPGLAPYRFRGRPYAASRYGRVPTPLGIAAGIGVPEWKFSLILSAVRPSSAAVRRIRGPFEIRIAGKAKIGNRYPEESSLNIERQISQQEHCGYRSVKGPGDCEPFTQDVVVEIPGRTVRS
jgi:hypothetical protein